jgi:hypothetical protein
MTTSSRTLTPFYNLTSKESFAILPPGMKLLETKVGEAEKGAAGWFLKIGEVLDLDALCHPAKLIEQGHIPATDKIIPTSLALRGLLFDLVNGKKHQYMQAPLPVAQVFSRSTLDNEDAQFLYGINFSSAIGHPHNPDAYYQISLVFDTRTGKITSGWKVRPARGNLEGELTIIGYLLSGRLEEPEVKADPIPPWQEIHTSHTSAGRVYESSIDRGEVLDQGELGSSTAHSIAAALEVNGEDPNVKDALDKLSVSGKRLRAIYYDERPIDSEVASS